MIRQTTGIYQTQISGGAGQVGGATLAMALLAYDKLAGVSVGYGPTAGGRVVRIIGTGFTGATGVTFGGTAGTSFSVVSNTLIEVTAPAKAAGAYDVVVQHPTGNSTIASGYTYVAAPSISGASYSLTTDTFTGGGLVNVTGATGIRAGSTLTLGGVAVGFIYVSATAFSFHIPTIAIGSTGAKDLVITQLDGQTGTKTNAVTYTKDSDIAEFTDGATMDAAAAVNGVYRLVGASTGAEIALLECVTTGPVTYRLKGRCRPFQASGTEFTGVFKPVAVGTAGAITWGGTPGSRTLGGMALADGGTVTWEGLVAVNGYMWTIVAAFYIATWESTPASQNCILTGMMRTGTNTIYSGGLMRTAGSTWTSGAGAAQNRDAPSLTTGTTTYSTTVGEYDAMATFYSNSTNQTVVGHFLQPALSKAPGAANATSDTTADRRPCFTRVGDTWSVRLLEWAMTQGMQ